MSEQPKIPQIVEVKWLDSIVFNNGGWVDLEEVLNEAGYDAMIHRTVGYLLQETEHAFVVAASLNYDQRNSKGNERVQGAVIIPKAAIVERQQI